jgi:hypothetical protein
LDLLTYPGYSLKSLLFTTHVYDPVYDTLEPMARRPSRLKRGLIKLAPKWKVRLSPIYVFQPQPTMFDTAKQLAAIGARSTTK